MMKWSGIALLNAGPWTISRDYGGLGSGGSVTCSGATAGPDYLWYTDAGHEWIWSFKFLKRKSVYLSHPLFLNCKFRKQGGAKSEIPWYSKLPGQAIWWVWVDELRREMPIREQPERPVLMINPIESKRICKAAGFALDFHLFTWSSTIMMTKYEWKVYQVRVLLFTSV